MEAKESKRKDGKGERRERLWKGSDRKRSTSLRPNFTLISAACSQWVQKTSKSTK